MYAAIGEHSILGAYGEKNPLTKNLLIVRTCLLFSICAFLNAVTLPVSDPNT